MARRRADRARQKDSEQQRPEEQLALPATLLPMEIQVGDRFTDRGSEWEVLIRPAHMHGAKTVRVRIARPGLPETERDMTWSAHERVEIRRGSRSAP